MNLIRHFSARLKTPALCRAAALLILLQSASYAAFEDTSVGARATGLGGLCVALTDDVNSIYHNPSGLALLPQSEFSAQYNRLYLGMDDNSNLGCSFVGIAQPIKTKKDYGTVGFGWMRFALDNLYKENTFILSYAKYGFFKRVNLGLNLKYLSLGYGQDQYTANAIDINGNATGSPDALFETYGTSKSNMDLDLGVQYQFAQNYRAGLMLANLLEPNMALESGVKSVVPRAYKLGLTNMGDMYLITIDSMFKKFNDTMDWNLSAGAEGWFVFGMGLRGSILYGSRQLAKVSFGLGYKVEGFQVDYALNYPISGIKNTYGDHKISLIVRFGTVIRGPVDSGEYALELQKEQRKRAAAEQELQKAKTEIEKLRKELEVLLSKDTEIAPPEPMEEKPKAVIKEAPAESGYETEYRAYVKNAASMPMTRRIDTLVEIIRKYRYEVDTAKAEAELRRLNGEQETIQQQYNNSLVYYRKMVSRGIEKKEQTFILNKIIEKYKGKLDITDAERELDMLSENVKDTEKSFRDSLNYYRKMKEKGMKKAQQIDLLNRVIKKYEEMGVDVSEAKRELGTLQQGAVTDQKAPEVNRQQAEKQYRDSLAYYNKMVIRGISTRQKIDLLKRVITKYSAMGVNVSEAAQLLKALEK